MTLRDYTPDDKPTIDAWASARGKIMPWSLLPPDAYIVEDGGTPVAFVTFTLALRVPLIWMDWLFSRPGTRMQTARKAFRMGLLEVFSRHYPAYSCCRVSGLTRAIAREAKVMGFTLSPSGNEGFYIHRT